MARSPSTLGIELSGDGLLRFVETEQHLDSLLSRIEARLGILGQLHPALEQIERLFERQITPFELFDDVAQFRDGGFEVRRHICRGGSRRVTFRLSSSLCHDGQSITPEPQDVMGQLRSVRFDTHAPVAIPRPLWHDRLMYSWKTSLRLDAPRDKVWNTLIDFANINNWNPGAGRAIVETEGELGQGSRVRLERGRRVTLLTVEEWGPPRLLRLYLTRGRTNGSARYYLTNAPGGGTQLEHHFELDPPIYLEPFMVFAGLGVKRELQALKRWVEKK